MMKITEKNYFSIIKNYEEDLPEGLVWSLVFFSDETKEGKDWSRLQTDKKFKEVALLAFKRLEEYIDAKANKRIKKTDMKTSTNPKSKFADIALECRFIQRFLAFHDQILYKSTFGVFIDELQTAIFNHKITRKSPVAKDIMQIQSAVVKQFNAMQNAAHFVLTPSTIKHFKSIITKYENSYEDIDQVYVKSKRKPMTLDGITPLAQTGIVSSTELANREYKTIGFDGKWKELIGDPCPGFKASVSGMPKMGKSFLCVEFASYLASRFGRVLYVAKEEFMSPTFQLKIRVKNAQNANLDIAGSIPSDLSPYQYVFLDSVTSLKLSADALKALEESNPGKSFIYVFQVTKAGKARGTNEFMHNVDIIVEVPERGKAVQYGRYNQGGEINIFDSQLVSLPAQDNV